MIVFVTGTRGINNAALVHQALDLSGFTGVTQVLTCGRAGPESIVEAMCQAKGIPVDKIRINWDNPDGTKNMKAGHQANDERIAKADAGVILWDGESKGTGGVWAKFQNAMKPYFILYCKVTRVQNPDNSFTESWDVDKDKEPFWFLPSVPGRKQA